MIHLIIAALVFVGLAFHEGIPPTSFSYWGILISFFFVDHFARKDEQIHAILEDKEYRKLMDEAVDRVIKKLENEINDEIDKDL